MCTVSLIPLDGQYLITSNRDERITRPLAYAPSLEQVNGKWLLFPKDPMAGGTWYAAAEDGTVAALLNGAFVPHTRLDKYRKSRGLVVLDILSANDPFAAFGLYNLDQIEPFTLLLFDRTTLREHRWDGAKKYVRELSLTIHHIYSSVTLYPAEVIKQREKWFEDFMSKGNVTPDSVRQFHATAGGGDLQNGLVINRSNFLKTQCITQTAVQNEKIDFYYHDLITETEHNSTMQIRSKP